MIAPTDKITDCSTKTVIDFDTLMQAIATGEHDIDIQDFQSRANLPDDWNWDDVVNDKFTAQEIDDMIHAGLR